MSTEELQDERDVLLMSLEDLDREHEAGDLCDEDYRLLRDLYTARAATVLRELEGRDASDCLTAEPETPSASGDDSGPHRNRPGLRTSGKWRRRPMVAIATVLVGVLVMSIVLVVEGTSTRLPGDSATGSISLSRQQSLQRELAQAQSLEASGDSAEALVVYHQVLEQDPTQEEALAESGWLEYEAGAQAKNSSLLSQGQDDEQKAEQSDPRAFAPHLYLGSMLLVESDYRDAVEQFKLFLSDSPPSSVVSSAAPFIDRAYQGAGLSAPSLP